MVFIEVLSPDQRIGFRAIGQVQFLRREVVECGDLCERWKDLRGASRKTLARVALNSGQPTLPMAPPLPESFFVWNHFTQLRVPVGGGASRYSDIS
jgi:hypothetical protein